MGMLTSQKINEYYARFEKIDVTFSKEIIQVTGLVTAQVYLKCVGDFWPCVIFSSSFQGAKLVVNTKSGILHNLEKSNNVVSLRYCFQLTERGNPVSFFVNARSMGYTPYGNSPDVVLFSLQFTQRPPDVLIEIMGRVLDANMNSSKRQEERVPITPESMRKLNMTSKESAVYIQSVPRRCILRDISFSGAKIIMMGVAKILMDKEALIKMDFDDPRQSFLVKGNIIRSEAVEGRKELVALALHFDESLVPMGYKVRINEYLSQFRVENRMVSPVEKKALAAKAASAAGAGGATVKKAAPAAAVDAWPSVDEVAPSASASDALPEVAAFAEVPAAAAATADSPALDDVPLDMSLDDSFDLKLPT
ncbi:MAG: PilZ domain-containing protein [Treponema sp.]|nr:PilZ domain-containing protein [Treponema sp.]